MERRKIFGFPLYEIEDTGRVYSLWSGSWREKKAINNRVGYPSISLWNKGLERRAYVHHLVLETFIGPKPAGCEALHGDGNRFNNAVENLRWGTRKENMADAARHGTATSGSRNGGAKLTEADIWFLRDMKELGFTPREVASAFSVAAGTIRRIYSGITYKREMGYGV